MSDQGGMGDCGSSCQQQQQLKLYQAFIFATPIIFTVVLLLLFCLLYLRRRQHSQFGTQTQVDFWTQASRNVDHGLTESFRGRLPVVAYDDKFAAKRDDTQCSICLGDYQRNESLQLLPVCGHAFHLECIDAWLGNNVTCPICRTSFVQNGKIVPISFAVHQQVTTDREVAIGSSSSHVIDVTEVESASRNAEAERSISATQEHFSSFRSASSMEDVVKDSVQHAIQIER